MTEKLRKKGVDIQPVTLSGSKIATSFWGKGWCRHMESFHDYSNRLPRGRSYVRNGSVVHLDIGKGVIVALVAGSKTYSVEIQVELLSPSRWESIKQQCAGQVASLLDLLRGKLSDGVMRVVTDQVSGLFPGPKEFKMNCSCPDYASMCKHIAAVFYGVGARLDEKPELLFLLRGVDHNELALDGGVETVIAKGGDVTSHFADVDLSEMFGIELVEQEDATVKTLAKPAKQTKSPRAAKPTRVKKEAKKSAEPPKRQKDKTTTKEKVETAKPPAPAARKPRQSRITGAKKQQDTVRQDKVVKKVKKRVASKKGVAPTKRSR
jgi:uncharacterized Zn finger protein